MILSAIIGPPETGNTSEPPAPHPKLNVEPLMEAADVRLLDLLQQGPLLLWNAINRVVDYDRPKSSAGRDHLRVKMWSRVRRLLRLGVKLGREGEGGQRENNSRGQVVHGFVGLLR